MTPMRDAYILRERWPALLSHGVAALIAGRRDQRTHSRPAPPGGPGPAHPDAHRPGEPGLPGRRARASAGAERRDSPGHGEAGRDGAAAQRGDDPDPPVAAGPGPARARRGGQARWRRPRRRPARPRLRRRPRPPGRPRPACGVTDSSSQIRIRSGTLSRTTERSARRWSCRPRWRTWPSSWPSAAGKRRPGLR